MSDLYYTGGTMKNRYYYKIQNISKKKEKSNTSQYQSDRKVSRISCQEYDDSTKNKNLGKIKPNIGSKVTIIVKPYHKYNCVTGIVKKVLTKKNIHTRGHKVILDNGLIGRTLKVIKL